MFCGVSKVFLFFLHHFIIEAFVMFFLSMMRALLKVFEYPSLLPFTALTADGLPLLGFISTDKLSALKCSKPVWGEF